MVVVSLLWVMLLGCPKEAPISPTAVESAPAAIVYPPTPRGDVFDTYFGVTVADPYRWMETPDTPEVQAWITAQNALTRSWIDAEPAWGRVNGRLAALWNFERAGVPVKQAGRYFFTHNSGLQDQSVLYVADALDGARKVVLDPNTLSEDGTISLTDWQVSEDGRWLAYGVSDGGADWNTWRVRDLGTGADLPDVLSWVKFSSVAWTHDHAGFFYARYAEPKDPLEQVNHHHKLYYHKVGTPQSEDVLVYERTDQPEWGFAPEVSDDGKTLLISVWQGTEEKNRLYLKDLTKPDSPVVPLLDGFDAAYVPVASAGSEIWLKTNRDAPKGRVVRVDAAVSPPTFTEVVPQAEETLEAAVAVGDALALSYLQDARSLVRLFARDGAPRGELALPGLGTASALSGDPGDPEAFFSFTSYTTPPSVYRADVTSATATAWHAPKVDFDPEQYETKQVFYPSADGTKIPMFIVHRKGLVLDGSAPAHLYGYGGFNVPLTPGFKVSTAVWLELGGVFAVANLRGGGEYGEAWHEAGTQLKKQNVFDDFAAAAAFLVDQGYTRPEKLGISGRSNGGLLVGATVQQHPEQFGAAIAGVGVMDMLRYHQFTIGWAWASDYGTSADSEEMFRYLHAYSPAHNAKAGTAYPAVLVTTGDHDDRVVPAHSYKFTAAMQAAQAAPDPILIRVETRAGHGAGTPVSMQIEQATDEIAFFLRALDVRP